MSDQRLALALAFSRPVRYAAEPGEDMAGLHRSLISNPRDQLPSLVYADYIEEQGMPHAAEVIRRHQNPGDTKILPNRPALYLHSDSGQTGHFAEVGPGGWRVDHLSPNILALQHRSVADPDTIFRWYASSLPWPELVRLYRGLVSEGVVPDEYLGEYIERQTRGGRR